MPRFRYQALNAEQQLVAGHITADAVAQAIAQLETDGLLVQSIGYAPEGDAALDAGPALVRLQRPPQRPRCVEPDPAIERSLIAGHLARVLPQCRPLIPALRAYADEMPSDRRRIELLEVCRVVERGDASEAAADLLVLPEYWIPLLTAAAQTNDAGQALHGFHREARDADQLSRQLRKALFYPAVLLVLIAAVATALAFIIFPDFRSIYEDFDFQMASVTIFFVNAAEAITDGTLPLIVGAVGVAGLSLYLLRRRLPNSLRLWFADRFGALLGRSTTVAQFTRFTADLLDAGVDVPSAIRIAASTSRRPRLRNAGWQFAETLESGAQTLPRRGARLLTATALHALRADVATSTRSRLLRELSGVYATRARRRLEWSNGAFGSFAIAAVGTVVGGVALALFLPLIDLIDNLSG